MKTNVFIHAAQRFKHEISHFVDTSRTSTSWIFSLPKHYARAEYSPKQLKYVRNCTSVRTEDIKVLSRDRQVGRRDIRSLAAAAIPLFPFLVESFLLFFLFRFLAKEISFLYVRKRSCVFIHDCTTCSLHSLYIYWMFRNFQCKRKRQVFQWYRTDFSSCVSANLSSSEIDSKGIAIAQSAIMD